MTGPTLADASIAELRAAADRHRARLAAIDAGAPATPDSAPAARTALARIAAELDRRRDPWIDVTARRG